METVASVCYVFLKVNNIKYIFTKLNKKSNWLK
jgi:hypothetical protein